MLDQVYAPAGSECSFLQNVSVISYPLKTVSFLIKSVVVAVVCKSEALGEVIPKPPHPLLHISSGFNQIHIYNIGLLMHTNQLCGLEVQPGLFTEQSRGVGGGRNTPSDQGTSKWQDYSVQPREGLRMLEWVGLGSKFLTIRFRKLGGGIYSYPDWRPRLAEQVNRGKQTTFLDEERNVVKSLPS